MGQDMRDQPRHEPGDSTSVSSLSRPVLLSALGCQVIDAADDAMRAQFRQNRAIELTDFIAPDLLNLVLERTRSANWVYQNLPGYGSRYVEAEPTVVARVFHTVLSNSNFLDWLGDLTGTAVIRRVGGELSETREAAPDLQLRWHNDRHVPGNRLAMTINLSDHSSEGGNFILRDVDGTELAQYKHTKVGAALIFRLSNRLEHCLTPLESGGPRRIFGAIIGR